MRRSIFQRQRAFTLIELLVVILIIGILLAVAAPSFLGQTAKAYDSEAKRYLTVAYRSGKGEWVENGDAYELGAPGDAQSDQSLFGWLSASEPEMSFVSASTGVSAANPRQLVIEPIGTTQGSGASETSQAVAYIDEARDGNIFCAEGVEQGASGVNPGYYISQVPAVATTSSGSTTYTCSDPQLPYAVSGIIATSTPAGGGSTGSGSSSSGGSGGGGSGTTTGGGSGSSSSGSAGAGSGSSGTAMTSTTTSSSTASATGACNGEQQTPYSETVLSDNPIGDWRFCDIPATPGPWSDPDEVSGGASMTGAGQLQATAPFPEGGTAMDNSNQSWGSNGTIDSAASAEQVTSAYSLEGWVKISSSTATGPIMQQSYDFGPGAYYGGFDWYINYGCVSNNNVVGVYQTGTAVGGAGSDNGVGSYCLTPGKWYYLVVTYSDPVMTLYVNGIAQSAGTAVEDDNTNSGRFYVADGIVYYWSNPGYPNHWPLAGTLSDLAVYNYALTAQQVSNHWAAAGQ